MVERWGILHHERYETGWPEGCILQDMEELTGQGPEQFDLTLKSTLLLQRFRPDHPKVCSNLREKQKWECLKHVTESVSLSAE